MGELQLLFRLDDIMRFLFLMSFLVAGATAAAVTSCEEGEMLCPGGVDGNNCPEEDFCHPAKVPNVLKDQDCDANCPVRCGPEEKACPGGIGDGWGTALGCPKPETCMPIMDSDHCPTHCPAVCGLDDIVCPGGADGNGCPNPDMCMPGTYFTGGVDGIDCPAHCPAHCNPEWQMVCEGAFDADGCRMPETCEPAMDGEYPNFCPVYCPPDDMHKYCPGSTNPETGRQEPGWCMLCWSGLDSPTCKCEPDYSLGTGPSA